MNSSNVIVVLPEKDLPPHSTNSLLVAPATVENWVPDNCLQLTQSISEQTINQTPWQV